MRKENSEEAKINHKSFYFHEYNYNSEISSDNKGLKINEDRIYLLFFIFFCLIFIFSIKILITSLQSPFSKLTTQNFYSFKTLRNDIKDRNGETIAKNIVIESIF